MVRIRIKRIRLVFCPIRETDAEIELCMGGCGHYRGVDDRDYIECTYKVEEDE